MATYSGSDKRIKYLFENGGGGGSSSLAGLSDVNLSSPTDGQVLTYDANNSKWINAAGGSGGGGAVYVENVLWSNSSGATAGTVTLSDNISNYDMLVFETSNSGIDETVHSQVVVPVSMIDKTGVNAFGAASVGGGENYVQLFRYVSDTSISLAWWTGAAPLKYYKIIGIKIVGGGVNYSTNEQIIGTWIDGKTLYQLTVELSSEVLIQTNSWYTTSISNANINNIIFANGINAEGSQFPLMANCDATGSGVNYVQIGNPRYGDIRIKTFTIQYTKTSA